MFVRPQGTEWETGGRIGTFRHDTAAIRLQRRLAQMARFDEFKVPLAR